MQLTYSELALAHDTYAPLQTDGCSKYLFSLSHILFFLYQIGTNG